MSSLNVGQVALIEVVVAALEALLVVVVGVIGWRWLRAARRAYAADTLLRLHDELGTHTAFEDTDAALGLPARIEEYTPQELELATSVTRDYERLAFLVESGVVPAAGVLPLHARRIVWVWQALQPFIREQRRLRDVGGAYRLNGDGRAFEALAQRAARSRARLYKDEKQAQPPVPAEYRERVRQAIARGERIGARNGSR